MKHPQVQSFFDSPTSTFTHVVHDGPGSAAIIIDSVLNYEHKSGRTRTDSADAIVSFVRQHRLQVRYILETHAHADHLSAAPYLQQQVGGQIGISEKITGIQRHFSGVFDWEASYAADGSEFDLLLADGQTLSFGDLTVSAIPVPGHTPACLAYEVGDAIFVGDTLFMPDVGTARCDFPGGDAHALYQSVRRLLARPDDTRLFMCHDYPNTDRPVACLSTVGEQRAGNIHVHDGVSEAQFVALRTQRDAGLDMPMLILPSIQVNARGGRLPAARPNGKRYLQIPIDVL